MIKLLTLGLILAGCRDNLNYDDVYTGATHGKIAGIVTSTDGVPLAGVTVTAQNVTATTDENGTYTLLDVSPSQNIVVKFSKQGYAKNYKTTAMQTWETVSSNASLLEADGTSVIDSQIANTIVVEGTTVRFSENAFVKSDGSEYVGDVTVQVTHVDPSTDELVGAPRDLTAITRQSTDSTAKDATTTSQLVSYGMVDVSLFSANGEELNLSPEEPAYLEIPITNGDLPDLYHLSDGDSQSAWSFDPDRGSWVEEGVGVIVEEDGNSYFQFEADHFSWWNCDQGFVPSCATGKVVDTLEFPVRGAEVVCAGGQSTTTAVTDDDGNYVCSILVGDTVRFTGTTFVDNRNWSNNVSKFMDGEGSDANTCEPIDTIQIDVCRLAGAINVQNMRGTSETMQEMEADNIIAFFWEPLGDPFYCDDLWQSLEPGTCWTGTQEEVLSSFPQGATPGMPDDSRSVGSWLEVRTDKNVYRIERETVSGEPNYNWDSHTVDGPTVSDHRPEFNNGDVLDVQAPGDYSSYFGAWELSEFATVPTATEFSTTDTTLDWNNANLTVTYNNHDDENVFVNVLVGETQMLCKFDDTGRFTINSMGLDTGFGGLSIQHVETELFPGPDGLPIRTMVLSGESVAVNVK